MQVPTAPDDFPFRIGKGDPKRKTVNLTRELNGEKIFVCIAMPETTQEHLCTSSTAGVCLPELLNLYVKIGKANGKLVDFGVNMCPHVIQVHMMSVMEPPPQSHDDELQCFGVHHVEAEGSLQSALQEYLKIRGILPCYAEYIYNYMAWTSKQEHLNSLRKMSNFIRD